MKKTNSFTYSEIILLDDTRINELQTILLKYCNRFIIEAKTIDESTVEFESFDELLKYDNFKNNRINTLAITGENGNVQDVRISLSFSAGLLSSTSVSCSYKFANTDDETLFDREIHVFLEKANDADSPSTIWFLVSAALGAITLFLTWSTLTDNINSFVDMIRPCWWALVISTVSVSIVWRKLIPSVSFYWGEAKKYYNKQTRIRNGLLWGVMGAVLVSIAANIMQDQLFTFIKQNWSWLYD